MSKKRSFSVSLRGKTVKVYPWTHSGTGKEKWRFAWYDDDKREWRYVTRAGKAEAKRAAEKLLQETGEALVWSALSLARQRFLARVNELCNTGDEQAMLEWLESRGGSSKVEEVVQMFDSYKVKAAGEVTPHLKEMKNVLTKFSNSHKGRRLADISSADVLTWWGDGYGDKSPKRQKDIRAMLVQMWTWAKKQGLAGSGDVTPADRLPLVKVGRAEKRVLTIAEMWKLLAAVKPEMRINVVLSGFAGLRPEEVKPKKGCKSGKRGLRAEEIDWDFKVIRLPAEVSKVERARIIPFNAALEAGLAWAGIKPGMVGALASKNMAETEETQRLGKECFGGKWPQDALRHTYGSMRNAVIRSLEQVSEEMGNSVAMLQNHYHNPKATAEGEAWFSMLDEETEGGESKLGRIA